LIWREIEKYLQKPLNLTGKLKIPSKYKKEKENLSNVWQGVVLEESLDNKSLLDLAKIIGTDISRLEKEDRIMTFHKIEVSDSQ